MSRRSTSSRHPVDYFPIIAKHPGVLFHKSLLKTVHSHRHTHLHTSALTCFNIILTFFLFFSSALLRSNRTGILWNSFLFLQLVEFVGQSYQAVGGNLMVTPDRRHGHCVTCRWAQKPVERDGERMRACQGKEPNKQNPTRAKKENEFSCTTEKLKWMREKACDSTSPGASAGEYGVSPSPRLILSSPLSRFQPSISLLPHGNSNPTPAPKTQVKLM